MNASPDPRSAGLPGRTTPPGRGGVAGIVLAAGGSRRMGEGCKLLLPLGGQPMVRRAVQTLERAGLGVLVVVLGQNGDRVRAALEGLALRFVQNPRWDQGMGTSLSAGVSALDPDERAVAVALGDMPWVSPSTVRRVVAAYERGSKGIVAPSHLGRRGHPVVFDLSRYRTELLRLSGDLGARALLAAHSQDVLEVSTRDPGVCLDVDTRADYERALALAKGPAGRRR